MKVLYLTNIPSPYRVDFFNLLGQSCDLTVLFERAGASDRNAAWLKRNFTHFKGRVLPGIRVGASSALCPSVVKYLSDSSFDVIIVGGYSTPTGILAIGYLKAVGKPFFINSDGGFIKMDSPFMYHVKSRLIGSAKWWLSSGGMTSDCLAHYSADRARIFEYPFTSVHAVDIRPHPPTEAEKAQVRQQLGLPDGLLMLGVGRLIKGKDYDVLLKAWALADQPGHLFIAGDGPEHSQLLALKDSLGLNSVVLLGHQTSTKLSGYYAAADVFVHPTREDVWGLVINEAMASGLPVVSTDRCIAAIELLPNTPEHIVPVGDADALAAALRFWKHHDRQAASARNLARIREYTLEASVRRHVEIWQDALSVEK